MWGASNVSLNGWIRGWCYIRSYGASLGGERGAEAFPCVIWSVFILRTVEYYLSTVK